MCVRNWLVGVAATALAFAGLRTASAEYMITDLGALISGQSRARGINNAGDVVGGGGGGGILWSNGQVQYLGTSGDAYSVNSSRQIVGEYGFLWSNGQVQSLGSLGGGYAIGYSINDAGQVVGYSTNLSGYNRAFLWFNGHMQDLATFGGTESRADRINNLGQVAGSAWTANGEVHAFLYTGGTKLDLNLLGGTYSRAFGINDAADVVGIYSDSDLHSHPFLYSNGNIKDLGLPSGALWGDAIAINNRAKIVGTYRDASGTHAAVYLNGQMRDLTDLLSPNSGGWALTTAWDINDSGQIVGYGAINGQDHAYLLTPGSEVPEPCTLLVWCGLGAVATVMVWRRKRQTC